MEAARRAFLVDEEARQMGARDWLFRSLAAGFMILRGAPMRVLTLLRTLLMVSLVLMERVLGNRTRKLVDRLRYASQVCFTYHLALYFLCIGKQVTKMYPYVQDLTLSLCYKTIKSYRDPKSLIW